MAKLTQVEIEEMIARWWKEFNDSYRAGSFEDLFHGWQSEFSFGDRGYDTILGDTCDTVNHTACTEKDFFNYFYPLILKANK